MIMPFKREWMRSPIFVGSLVMLAVVQWRTALGEIREIRFKAEAATRMNEVVRAIESLR